MSKINLGDYFDLGLSEDELGDWGLSDDEEKAPKKMKGEKGGKGGKKAEVEVKEAVAVAPPSARGRGAKLEAEVKEAVAGPSASRGETPPLKKTKTDNKAKVEKVTEAETVVVSKKEWERMKQQLELIKKKVMPEAAPAPPAAPVPTTRAGSRAALGESPAKPNDSPKPALKRARSGSRLSLQKEGSTKVLDK